MAQLSRHLQKIFGSTGGTSEFGKIGSEAAGSPATSKDLDQIQSLSQYLSGLYAITASANEPPRIQDINALYFLITSQLSYLFQTGISAYLSTEEYYVGSVIVDSNSNVYISIYGTDGDPNQGNTPSTSPTYWTLLVKGTGAVNKAISTDYNNSLGYQALYSISSGQHCNAIGYQTLYTNSTASYNNGYGSYVLYSNSTGTANNGFGYNVLRYNTGGNYCSGFGHQCLEQNTIGDSNTGMAFNCLTNNTTGAYNTGMGCSALNANIDGNENCSFGNDSMRLGQHANNCCAFGVASLQNNEGDFNNGFGQHTLQQCTTGEANFAGGYNCLEANQTGDYNVGIGHYCLTLTTASGNTGMGYYALSNCIGGAYNTGIGHTCLSNVTSGNNNSALGYACLTNLTTGGNCAGLGYNAQASAAGVSNEITLGDSNITSLRCQVALTVLSDMRDKTDIKNMPLDALNFINDISTKIFKFDKREWYENGEPDGSKKEEKFQPGCLAQDLDELQKKYNANYLNLVYYSNPEKLETTPERLIFPIIKAIQELNKKIEDLKEKLNG